MGAGANELYRTSDIYFAAFLCSVDVPMQGSEWEEVPRGPGDRRSPRKLVWVFKLPKGAVGKLRSSFFSNSGTVKARQYADNLKSLKQMCHV
jgi:hypothetical protein